MHAFRCFARFLDESDDARASSKMNVLEPTPSFSFRGGVKSAATQQSGDERKFQDERYVGDLFSVGLLTASLIVNRVLESIGFLSGSCSVSACSQPPPLSKQYFNQLIF